MGFLPVQWGDGECGGGLVRERKRSGWRLKGGLYNGKGKKERDGGTCGNLLIVANHISGY